MIWSEVSRKEDCTWTPPSCALSSKRAISPTRLSEKPGTTKGAIPHYLSSRKAKTKAHATRDTPGKHLSDPVNEPKEISLGHLTGETVAWAYSFRTIKLPSPVIRICTRKCMASNTRQRFQIKRGPLRPSAYDSFPRGWFDPTQSHLRGTVTYIY